MGSSKPSAKRDGPAHAKQLRTASQPGHSQRHSLVEMGGNVEVAEEGRLWALRRGAF